MLKNAFVRVECRKCNLGLDYGFNFSKSAVAVNEVSKKCSKSEKGKLPPKTTDTLDYYNLIFGKVS
uniref:Uncharacterized protein n=1 Tax=Onchocerca volvulus TaxID=6282 RepID=A0A8R1TN30_ONCVO